jgi:hypothetical protein
MTEEEIPELDDAQVAQLFNELTIAESDMARELLSSIPIEVLIFKKHSSGRWYAYISSGAIPIALVSAWRKPRLHKRIEKQVQEFRDTIG